MGMDVQGEAPEVTVNSTAAVNAHLKGASRGARGIAKWATEIAENHYGVLHERRRSGGVTGGDPPRPRWRGERGLALHSRQGTS
jgi:hypothetical protein